MSKPGLTKDGEVIRFKTSGTEIDALLADFDIDSFILKSKHKEFLDEVIAFAQKPGHGPLTISMDGFASRTGGVNHNLILSENREESVEGYLRTHASIFDAGSPHKINRLFHGFTDSPPGENPRFRSVRVVLHSPGIPPPPIPIPPAPVPIPPASTAVGTFRVDLIGWIPQPEVDNPIAVLPSFISSLLPAGMADPFFGGDDFSIPTVTPASMRPPTHTFRGSQSLDFEIPSWGAAPKVGLKTTAPGVTTCLNNRRAAGGVVTFSLAARVLASSVTVTFSSSDNWYEVNLSGMIVDPIPAAAATALASKISTVPHAVRPLVLLTASALATKATPSLTWDATIRIQQGATLSTLTAASYALFTGSENSGTLAGAASALAPGTDLIHGKIHFDKWPSAVIYLSFTPSAGTMVTQPIFFSSGLGVPRPEPAFIEVPKFCKLRQLTW